MTRRLVLKRNNQTDDITMAKGNSGSSYLNGFGKVSDVGYWNDPANVSSVVREVGGVDIFRPGVARSHWAGGGVRDVIDEQGGRGELKYHEVDGRAGVVTVNNVTQVINLQDPSTGRSGGLSGMSDTAFMKNAGEASVLERYMKFHMARGEKFSIDQDIEAGKLKVRKFNKTENRWDSVTKGDIDPRAAASEAGDEFSADISRKVAVGTYAFRYRKNADSEITSPDQIDLGKRIALTEQGASDIDRRTLAVERDLIKTGVIREAAARPGEFANKAESDRKEKRDQERDNNEERRWRSEIAAIAFLNQNLGNLGKDTKLLSNAMSGAITGGRALSVFGPWGQVAGSVFGAVTGLVEYSSHMLGRGASDRNASGSYQQDQTKKYAPSSQMAKDARISEGILGAFDINAGRFGLETNAALAKFSEKKQSLWSTSKSPDRDLFSRITGTPFVNGMSEDDVVVSLAEAAREIEKGDIYNDPQMKYRLEAFRKMFGGDPENKMLHLFASITQIGEKERRRGTEILVEAREREIEAKYSKGNEQDLRAKRTALDRIRDQYDVLVENNASEEEYAKLLAGSRTLFGEGGQERAGRLAILNPINFFRRGGASRAALKTLIDAYSSSYGDMKEGKEADTDFLDRYIMGTAFGVGDADTRMGQITLMQNAEREMRKTNRRRMRNVFSGNASTEDYNGAVRSFFGSVSRVADFIPGLDAETQKDVISDEDSFGMLQVDKAKFRSIHNAMISARKEAGLGDEVSFVDVVRFLSNYGTRMRRGDIGANGVKDKVMEMIKVFMGIGQAATDQSAQAVTGDSQQEVVDAMENARGGAERAAESGENAQGAVSTTVNGGTTANYNDNTTTNVTINGSFKDEDEARRQGEAFGYAYNKPKRDFGYKLVENSYGGGSLPFSA